MSDTLNIKISAGLRKRLEKAAARAGLSVDEEAARRLQASFKRRAPKRRVLKEYDRIIDLLVLDAVLKKPPRKASETIARLKRNEPFKSQGDLLSRHNKLKKALIESGKFEVLEDGVRNRGLDLMVRYGPKLMSLEKALEVVKKKVALLNEMIEADRLIPGINERFSDVLMEAFKEWSASPLGLKGAVEHEIERLRNENPAGWAKFGSLGESFGRVLWASSEEPFEDFGAVELSEI